MSNLEGEKVIFAVAQMPFEHAGDSDVVNMFGTLVPVVMADGDEVDETDFPNAGLVWWMVRPGIRSQAVPGRLLKGVLEPARRYEQSDPRSQFYQVHRDSVAPVDAEDLLEVITLEHDAAQEPRDLVSGNAVAALNRPPTGVVLIRWRGQVLGPFRTLSAGEGVVFELRLATLRADQTVTALGDEEFSKVVGASRVERQVEVSLSDNRTRAEAIMRCNYELLVGPGRASFGRPEHPRLKLETDAEIIRRVAKRLMPRRDRQSLAELLERLRERADDAGAEVSVDERRVVEAVTRQQKSSQVELGSLASALIDSGVLAEQIRQAIEARTLSYVSDNLAQLQAQVRQRMADETSRLEKLQTEGNRLNIELEERRSHAKSALARELEAQRLESERQIQASIDQATRIQQDQRLLQAQLEASVQHFKAERAGVIADVIATLTVLGETPHSGAPSAKTAVSDTEPQSVARHLTMPAFVTLAAPTTQPDEGEFFDRFRRHVETSGYQYRPIDLVSFHLSVKCGDITILGGLSGVGKSSLPRLYSDALAGESLEGRARYHEVAVSPSWLDMRDLLGYVNTLDRRFQPAESGLYQHLIFAHEEYVSKGMDSGVCLVNLDEMNLAQVEHYFSGFLQALERPAGQRRVACFSSASVGVEDPFAAWGELNLPVTLRFIGTVNLDETTKQLSLRLLDRANFIRLRPHATASAAMGLSLGTAGAVQGPPILFRTWREWIRPPQLPQELAVVWDEIRRALADLGTTVSPRRQRAIELFVASARDVSTPEAALDVQVTQRVLPQLRGAFTESARESLLQLAAIFERREPAFPETVRALHEMLDGLADAQPWA